MTEQQLLVEPIGFISTPYKQKFGIPRQPGIVTRAQGIIHFYAQFDQPGAFAGLLDFSHVWISFVFHKTAAQGWKPMVRPPRLGGKKKVGVFASRSMFRPNPVGLSVAKIDGLRVGSAGTELHVSGIDLLDQTPVLDIKPYLPYADCIKEAQSGYAPEPVDSLSVSFDNEVVQKLKDKSYLKLLKQILSQDPRPAYYCGEHAEKTFGMIIGNHEIFWHVQGQQVIVTEAKKVAE
ncbi:MAG: tRNA (N6-threonylcarbamoyladenosine(37)-N6)-methyltransferase TrmO [bacterium]